MNVAAHVIYIVFITLALIDMFLVSSALHRAVSSETVGRLVATMLVLGGLVLSGSGRLLQHPFTLPGLVFVGVLAVDIGLLGYALYLPEDGLLALIRRWWGR